MSLTDDYRDVIIETESGVKVTPFISLVEGKFIPHVMIVCKILDENGQDVSGQPIYNRIDQDQNLGQTSFMPEFDTALKMIAAVDKDKNMINSDLVFRANLRPYSKKALVWIYSLIWLMRIITIPVIILVYCKYIFGKKDKISQKIEEHNSQSQDNSSNHDLERLSDMSFLDMIGSMRPVGNVIIGGMSVISYKIRSGDEWFVYVMIPPIDVTVVEPAPENPE
jgi:hypothetical protein